MFQTHLGSSLKILASKDETSFWSKAPGKSPLEIFIHSIFWKLMQSMMLLKHGYVERWEVVYIHRMERCFTNELQRAKEVNRHLSFKLRWFHLCGNAWFVSFFLLSFLVCLVNGCHWVLVLVFFVDLPLWKSRKVLYDFRKVSGNFGCIFAYPESRLNWNEEPLIIYRCHL